MAAKQPAKKSGRKPKINDVVIARICNKIKAGNTLKTACLTAGITYTTFYDWKTKGEIDRKEGRRSKYAEFIDATDHADAVGQARLVANVIKEGGWKGSLEILKRRFPKEFGDKTALSNADGTPIPIAGGAPVHVTFKFDQPEKDEPWEIDPSALPPAPEQSSEPPTTDPTPFP